MVGNFAAQPTLCNEYANAEREFVFCVKGRPFGCLVSPHLPTPTGTIIDYNLVRDIGMKMSDLQYTKFSFGGQKMRGAEQQPGLTGLGWAQLSVVWREISG